MIDSTPLQIRHTQLKVVWQFLCRPKRICNPSPIRQSPQSLRKTRSPRCPRVVTKGAQEESAAYTEENPSPTCSSRDGLAIQGARISLPMSPNPPMVESMANGVFNCWLDEGQNEFRTNLLVCKKQKDSPNCLRLKLFLVRCGLPCSGQPGETLSCRYQCRKCESSWENPPVLAFSLPQINFEQMFYRWKANYVARRRIRVRQQRPGSVRLIPA
jgi:hypothetical protein